MEKDKSIEETIKDEATAFSTDNTKPLYQFPANNAAYCRGLRIGYIAGRSQNLAREKEYREALEVVHDLFERFMPKEVAMDDYKQMAMYEAYHRIKQLLKPLNNV